MRPDRSHVVLAAQLAGTLAILAWVPGNGCKLLAFLVLWAASFRRLDTQESGLAVLGAVLFTVLDVLTIRRGAFHFSQPDLLGLPIYEPALWAFYLVHMKRVLALAPVEQRDWRCWFLLLLFAPVFSLSANPTVILVASGLVLGLALFFFHQPADVAFAGYAVLLGAAVEYVGVHAGLWSYPVAPIGGVPLWFVTMWGGIGFFLHRLVLAKPPVDAINEAFCDIVPWRGTGP